MRTYIPAEIPREFDPRLVKILRNLNGYLEQVDKGFAHVQRGEIPVAGGPSLPAGITSHHLLTDLNSHDDHSIYALLAGRSAGQTLYGTNPSSLSASWTNTGDFISEQSKTPGSSWVLTIDTSASVGDIIILTLATLPFVNNTDADTTDHTTITDAQGNTWTKLKEHTYAPDTFSNGTCLSVWSCIVAVALTAGVDSVTVNYSGSIGAMAVSSHRFTGGAGSVTIAASSQKSDALADPSALSVSAARDNYLFIRATSQGQGGSTVIGTINASSGFTNFDHTQSKTVGGSGNVGSFGEYQTALTAGASTDPTSTASSGYFNSILVALTIPPAPSGDLILASQNHPLAGRIQLHDDQVKVATAASQKLGFWAKAPNVQPTTAITAATFVANTSGIVNDSATFDGYTIGKVVAALRRAGLLA